MADVFLAETEKGLGSGGTSSSGLSVPFWSPMLKNQCKCKEQLTGQ